MYNLIYDVLNFIYSFPELLSFLAPIFSGEGGIIFISFLAANGSFSMITVLIFSFLGLMFIDSLWFFFSKTKIYKKFIGRKGVSKHYKKLERRIENISHKKSILILLISKALIGTRILIIFFISLRKIKFQKFLALMILPNFIWASILIFIGYLARSSYESTLRAFKSIQIAIFITVLFIVLFYYIIKGFNKWIIN